jgi:hypothetical protein
MSQFVLRYDDDHDDDDTSKLVYSTMHVVRGRDTLENLR